MIDGLSGAFTIINAFLRLFSDPGHFIQGAVQWSAASLYPPELQTWFLGTIAPAGSTWDATQIYQGIYQSVQAPALLIAAMAAAVRVLRGALDARASAMHAIIDVLPRFLAVVAFIGVPGNSTSLCYIAITFVVNGSMLLAHLLFQAIVHASLMQGMQPGEGWFTHVYQIVANAGHSAVAVVIGGVPLLILLLYAMFLMVVRTIMIGFIIVTAPLCVATAVLDPQTRFIRWWMDMLIGAAMTPIVFAVSLALSLTLASSVVSAALVGPILAFIILCGGLWMSAKLVHHMTWRHFTHGSAMAGFSAGLSTAFAPMHKLAAAGHLAEAMGANKEGTNRVVTMMKRVGLASQGLGASAGGGSVAAGSLGGSAAVAAGMRRLVPSRGIPDMTAALDPQGRIAVSGSEAAFSAQAFAAFARVHGRHVGTLTRDHPYGSVSAADRTRIAWERSTPRAQREFADDFLASWLAHVPDDASRVTSEEDAA
jgi:hypothetical protein